MLLKFGKGKGVMFRRGEIIRTVSSDHAVEELMELVEAELAK